jgi:hypothetical protein
VRRSRRRSAHTRRTKYRALARQLAAVGCCGWGYRCWPLAGASVLDVPLGHGASGLASDPRNRAAAPSRASAWCQCGQSQARGLCRR